MPTNTSLHIELGTGFWVLIIVLVIVGILLATLGPSRLRSVIEGGIGDAFRRR